MRVKNRRSRLRKTPQTEKNTWHLPDAGKRNLVRNPKSKRPLKRLKIPLVPPPPTCTLWISVNSYGPSLSPFMSEVRHSSVASPIDQLYLPQQGPLSSQDLCAFYCSPVINKALIRSTLLGCKAVFLLPLNKRPNIQLIICHTITGTCTSQSLM